MFTFHSQLARHWRKLGRLFLGIVSLSLLLLRQSALTPAGIILDPAQCPQVQITTLSCTPTNAGTNELAEVETSQGAFEFRRLQLQDENGFIPPDGALLAAEHIKMMKISAAQIASVGGAQHLALAWPDPRGWTHSCFGHSFHFSEQPV